MKKFFKSSLIMIVLLMLTACGNAGTLEKAEVIEVNTAQNSETYIGGEDYQQNWNTWGSNEAKLFTMSENGYYYYSSLGTQLLYFHDYATNSTVPLCIQPNCKHSDQECSAYLPFIPTYLHFYDGNLYATCNDGSDVSVYRISDDGSTIGKVGTVFSLSRDDSFICIAHRGYLYCAVYTNTASERTPEVYRLSLSGSEEAEQIASLDPCFGGACYLSAYGNHVYIQIQHYEDSAGNGYNGDLYRYNIHTAEIELVLENVCRDFVVDSEYIYYDTSTQVVAYNLETYERVVLLDLGYPVFLALDGNNLYCDNIFGLSITADVPDRETDNLRVIHVIDVSTQEGIAVIPIGSDWDSQCDFIGVTQTDLITCLNYRTLFYTDLNAALSGVKLVFDQMN